MIPSVELLAAGTSRVMMVPCRPLKPNITQYQVRNSRLAGTAPTRRPPRTCKYFVTAASPTHTNLTNSAKEWVRSRICRKRLGLLTSMHTRIDFNRIARCSRMRRPMITTPSRTIWRIGGHLAIIWCLDARPMTMALFKSWMVRWTRSAPAREAQCEMYTWEANVAISMWTEYRRRRQLFNIPMWQTTMQGRPLNHWTAANSTRRRCLLSKIHSSSRNSGTWVGFKRPTTNKS